MHAQDVTFGLERPAKLPGPMRQAARDDDALHRGVGESLFDVRDALRVQTVARQNRRNALLGPDGDYSCILGRERKSPCRAGQYGIAGLPFSSAHVEEPQSLHMAERWTVLAEFEKIAERGGVLGAMETGYQRSKIQEESMHYEMLKHTGELPIIGVNTFRNPHGDPIPQALELARSTEEEKQSQLARLQDFHKRHAKEAPKMLKKLQQAVIRNENVFAVLMDAVRVCSLGQITHALFEVGGQYRRSM